MWEGMGVGGAPGRFESDALDWLSCPTKDAAAAQSSFWSTVQTKLGLRQTADEERWDDDVLCPFAWSKTLHKLNCEFPVWPAELDQPPYNESRIADTRGGHGHDHEDVSFAEFLTRPRRPHPDLLELDTPEYAGKIRSEWIVERLMATAGIRLAGLLNGLFMDAEQLQDGCTPLPLILV